MKAIPFLSPVLSISPGDWRGRQNPGGGGEKLRGFGARGGGDFGVGGSGAAPPGKGGGGAGGGKPMVALVVGPALKKPGPVPQLSSGGARAGHFGSPKSFPGENPRGVFPPGPG